MRIVPDDDRSDGRLLLDDDGAPFARWVARQRDGRPFADLLALADGVAVADAVPVLLHQLPGQRVSCAPELGRALVEAGAAPGRHSHILTRDLRAAPAPAGWADPPLPAGLTATPADRPAAEVAAVIEAAFPPGHGDWLSSRDTLAETDALLDGVLAGPLLPYSGLAVDPGGRVAAGVLVTRNDGDPPFGGPWVAQLFRIPDDAYAGAGRALVQRALGLATGAGEAAVTLVVTDGNPARRLYASLAFAHAHESFNVELPG